MSTSRLAPIMAMTTPRLELSAATMAVKIDKLVRSELDMSINESVFWTDGTIVMQYIYNDNKRFHTFVANRVALIREISEPKQWRHVDTQLNPADDASRGLNADQLINNERWFCGPSFLLKEQDEWPVNPVQLTVAENDPKVKPERVVYVTNVLGTVQPTVKIFETLFNRYSDWFQLKVTVAWLLRVKQFLTAKIKCLQPPDMRKALTASEIQQAELQIVKNVQKQVFSDELCELTSSNGARKITIQSTRRNKQSCNQIGRLEPILVDDILCVGGRLHSHQVILPKMHPVVTLFIRHFHVISGHSGREHVLSLVRQRYWIIKGRSAVRRVLSDCMFCKRLNAKPLGQRMANLPFDRISPNEPPFTFTGVDIFGTFLVKRGRCEVKRFGCLFTCLTIRAIHIEVIHSMETDSFLQALQRFISRRGQIKMLRSDNGTNFVGACNELRQALKGLDQVKINSYLNRRNIEWRFNPPTASHMGGVWERQIRSVRKILSVLLKEQALDDESLCTLMCLAEAIVNGRPITTISDDHLDPEALTPNHLLLLRSNASLTVGEPDDKDIYSRKRWRQVQYLADVFWRRWSREYLPTLQLRQKWHEPVKNLEVGDIVVLVDDKLPRNVWQLGRVIEVYPGTDGLVRSVKVTTKTTGGTCALIRPVHKLCLLETVRRQSSE